MSVKTQTGTEWDINDAPRLQATFMDANNAAVDPSTVKLRIIEPDGTQDDYTYAASTITKASTGIFYVDVPVDSAGKWKFRWESTEPNVAEEGWFMVRSPTVAPI